MITSLDHRDGTGSTGRWGIVRVLGAAWLLVHPAIVPVAAGAGEAPVHATRIVSGAGTATALPEGASVTEVRVLDGARTSERLSGLPGLGNVGRVAPGIFRGAQPRLQGYETLRKLGIRTVINLRPGHDERAKVEAAGMRMVEVPMTAEDVNTEAVRKALSAMADPANQPVFLHCKRGKHRAGAVVAAYRMEVEGWSRKEAKAEMRLFGYNDVYARITDFVEHYRAKGAGIHP